MRSDSSNDPAEGAGRVRLSVDFDGDDLRLKRTPFGTLVELKGSKAGGVEGGPALPRLVIKVAVPPLQWPTSLAVEGEKWVQLTRTPAFVAPVQRLRPGIGDPPAGHDPEQRAEADAERGVKPSTCRDSRERQQDREQFVEPYPAPPVVPPDPRLYEEAVRAPRPVARPLAIEPIGLVRVAQIELNPIRLNADGHLELCTHLELILAYSDQPPLADKEESRRAIEARLGHEIDPERMGPMPEPVITSAAHARRLVEIARAEVVNPDLVWPYGHLWPEIEFPAEYLIITDDRSWNAQSIAPGAAVPGLVAAFERLANWKSSRGLWSRVVTITDIVGGRFGDFRSGARDLQEVIRNFLKEVRPRWGVAWVLLGGDLSIVPIRQVAGGIEGHMAVGTDNPPKDNTSFWTGSFLKMHVVGPGTWWGASTMNQLVRPDTGQRIPYDPMGTSNATTPGWYFTTSDSYATRSAAPTEFVRVNGPAALLNATLQWLYAWNTIPTDFYYASLQSFVVGEITGSLPFGGSFSVPYVWFPERDWDGLDNGLYGQHTADGDLDGVVLATDVSVGRAPVDSQAQADAFVDKVISYEGFSSPWSGFSVDVDWPRRVVLAASNWGGSAEASATAANPPPDERYHHPAGAAFSLIKLKDAPADFEWVLIAELSATDRRIIPYSEVVGPGGRGWHFARSASDLSVNELVIPLPWTTIRFPMPTPWIVVFAPAAELTPQRYLLDRLGQDGSMVDQEALRAQLEAELPIFNAFTRLYEDDLDLTPGQAAAAPLQHLSAARLTAALNAGPHIVSLSGHGNSDGCCGGSVWLANGLTNGRLTFIGYADSCLTNQIDAEDAFSEALVYNASGGAVGYVGNTRFSWIGVGDNFQRAFFHRLTATRHLGLLNDSRCGLYGTTGYNRLYERWAIFALNLMGDPEMQVRKTRIRRIGVTVEGGIRRWPLVIKVVEVLPRKPWPEPEPLADVLVHLRQGQQVFSTRTDARGEARLDLSGLALGEIELTVSHDDFVPYQLRTWLTGPAWVRGIVSEVAHMEGGRPQTRVRLRGDEGERSYVARADLPDYRLILDAAENAYIAKEPIELWVDSTEDGGTIERFRFGEARPARAEDQSAS